MIIESAAIKIDTMYLIITITSIIIIYPISPKAEHVHLVVLISLVFRFGAIVDILSSTRHITHLLLSS